MIAILDLMVPDKDDPSYLFVMLEGLGIEYQLKPINMPIHELGEADAIILPGSSRRIAYDSLSLDGGIYSLGIPILGICYGYQLMVRDLGGECGESPQGIKGALVKLRLLRRSHILQEFGDGEVWMNHSDEVKRVPLEFKVTASTAQCRVAAMEHKSKPIYGVQFHPEQSPRGHLIFRELLKKGIEVK